jgi:hypothetical protein
VPTRDRVGMWREIIGVTPLTPSDSLSLQRVSGL